MFNDCSVFILSTDEKIYRLELERNDQQAICEAFALSVDSMISGTTKRIFEVNYKLEDDEIYRIQNFLLPDEIKDAIRNPIGVDSYKNDSGILSNGNEDSFGFPKIKAFFVGERIQDARGEHFNIGFQKYRKEQNLISLPFRFFFSNETFKREKHFSIAITDNLDCYYTDGELQFDSFFFARQVFDLRDYYRSASDPEVEEFTQNESLNFENADIFCGLANTYVRRKIAMINDSGILEKYTVKKIRFCSFLYF